MKKKYHNQYSAVFLNTCVLKILHIEYVLYGTLKPSSQLYETSSRSVDVFKYIEAKHYLYNFAVRINTEGCFRSHH